MKQIFRQKIKSDSSKVSVVGKSCQIVRLRRFDMPSGSKFIIIFQEEYKGPKNENFLFLVGTAPIPGFHTTYFKSIPRHGAILVATATTTTTSSHGEGYRT